MEKLYRLKILQRYSCENHSFWAVGKLHVTSFLFTFANVPRLQEQDFFLSSTSLRKFERKKTGRKFQSC